ncbi:FecCD family ABC transporter permease [Peribacillus glennii]|uniref:Iron ABC transporter permease n=1 Tax=Peribacillus glennii TaxID=2303991 RepID=A0A372LG40_9BACI|nr:iron ABC transporter permease [Peribacillus glennii]RFU65039.1 iron ABC transporter permease [Peribacillus glennii]
MGRHLKEQTNLPAGRAVRTGWILFAGIFVLIAAFFISLGYGSTNIGSKMVWQAFLNFDPGVKEHQVIHEIRLPRVITAAIIGAFLALSGAVMQALTRNPLAEPAIIGVSHGAAFALVVSLTIFPRISPSGSALVSMAGAGAAVLLVFSLASVSKGGISPVKLTLAGVAIGMFLSSLTSVIAIHFDVAKDLSFWYAGSLETSDWQGIKMLGVVGIIGIFIIILLARSLTLLSLGADVTKGLGINLQLVNILGVCAVLLLTGSSVAVSGTVSFVGLVVPHISRMLVGPDYRFSLPVSAVFGSLLLVLGDIGARMINPPYETPIGVITASIGVPFFLYLVRSGRSRL